MRDDSSGSGTTGRPRDNRLVLLTAFFGLALSVVYLYFLGPIVPLLEAEMGWRRSEVFAGLTIVSVVSVIGAPLGGIAVDRFGPRVIGLVGAVIYLAGIALLSLVWSVWSWYFIWLIVAVGSVLVKPTVWFAAVTRHFHGRRGFAMGIALCGAGLGAAVLPAVSAAFFQSLGWRAGLVALAAVSAAVMLPLLLFAFPVRAMSSSPSPRPQFGLVRPSTYFEGDRARDFVKLAVCGFLVNFSVMALVVNFVPMVRWLVGDTTHVTTIAAVIGITSILARPVSGWLMDSYSPIRVATVSYMTPIFAVGLLFFAGDELWGLTVAAGLIGIALGSEVDSFAYLSSRSFAPNEYGTKFGGIMALISLGVGMGPFAANLVFDLTQSYSLILIIVVPLLLLSSAIIMTLPLRS